MKTLTLAGLTAFAVFATAAPAMAERPDEGRVNFELIPGESRTFFVSSQDTDAALPVFKVCHHSRSANEVTLHVGESGMLGEHVMTQPMAKNSCLFTSGQNLAISVAASASSQTVAGAEDAEEKSAAWLQERVEALKTQDSRTDEEDVLLTRYRKMLSAQQSFITITLMSD